MATVGLITPTQKFEKLACAILEKVLGKLEFQCYKASTRTTKDNEKEITLITKNATIYKGQIAQVVAQFISKVVQEVGKQMTERKEMQKLREFRHILEDPIKLQNFLYQKAELRMKINLKTSQWKKECRKERPAHGDESQGAPGSCSFWDRAGQ